MKSSLSACERPIRHASNICLRNKAGGSLLQFCCLKEKGAETASSWWMGLKMLTTQLQRLHFKSTQGLKVAIKLLHTALTCKNTFISNSSVLDLHQAKWWLLFFLGLFFLWEWLQLLIHLYLTYAPVSLNRWLFWIHAGPLWPLCLPFYPVIASL